MKHVRIEILCSKLPGGVSAIDGLHPSREREEPVLLALFRVLNSNRQHTCLYHHTDWL
ncbi:MAG: hypothetical protein ABW089_14800 [Sedimenticola sp.]